MAEERGVDEGATYRICVRGRLDDRWSDWFSGLTVVVVDRGENPPTTALTGLLDQPALRGVLNTIWDLNLTLVSVVRLDADDAGSNEAVNWGMEECDDASVRDFTG